VASDTFWKTLPERWFKRMTFWRGGSLARRLIILATAWIIPLLALGGFTLDRVVTRTLTSNLDARLQQYLTSLIAVAEIGPYGEVRLSRPMGDQGFLEIYSGLYYQIVAPEQTPFRSRSLWDREIAVDPGEQLATMRTTEKSLWKGAETLRLVEQDVKLPGAEARMRFIVAERVDVLQAQIAEFRRTLLRALLALGLGLIILSGVQATYGLWPLRRVRRGLEAIRSGRTRRLEGGYPVEVQPLADEMNALLDHGDAAAEQARTHAGNLAHALKTPMAVLINEAQLGGAVDSIMVAQQVETMQKHVEHHLARARALGRRAMIGARTPVWPSIDNLQRLLQRIYAGTQIGLAGARDLVFRGEKQDLEEILGNLMDNGCKYGGGSVQVTVREEDVRGQRYIAIDVEDDGAGIPPGLRNHIFKRGARLDENTQGTGLGLAIVRDVAEIYGGDIVLTDSDALGGLRATLRLPAADKALD
jgi:signal transduction histidine kinase